MRKMASVRKIKDKKPIKGADFIEAYQVDGWWVVGKKGEFNIGDLVVYCEIDSWIPYDLAPFLSKGSDPKEYNQVKGQRLKTVKLKGQISQGLLFDLSVLIGEDVVEGQDVSETLGIVKYEPPIPASLAGNAKGVFPSFMKKTYQDRVQNIDLVEYSGIYTATEKLDGSSATFFLNSGEFGVCSRNLELKEDDTNTFWKVAKQYNIENKMREHNLEGYALQGELVGEGVRGNPYKIKGHKFFLFDAFNIKHYEYYQFFVTSYLGELLGIPVVPTLWKEDITISESTSVEDLLSMSDGLFSKVHPEVLAEGIVFKNFSVGDKSFKVISNQWLLKNE